MPRYTLYWYQLTRLRRMACQIVMPMADLYGPVLLRAFPKLRFSKWQAYAGSAQKCDVTARSEAEIAELDRFLTLLRQAVWIQNPELDCCMALEFNFAFDQAGETYRTETGQLEYAAKYQQDPDSINKLADRLVSFVESNPLYRVANRVVAVPPSEPKPFHLASVLAAGLSKRLGLTDLSSDLEKSKHTPPMKNLKLEEKKQALAGAFRVAAPKRLTGSSILLVDDLYQSGTTMTEVAKALKAAGAAVVLGLSAVKSLKDSDNIAEESK